MPTDATAWTPGLLDQRAITTMRMLAVDAVEQANSGHPGLPMGAAAMAYVLWTRHLRANPLNPHWFDRDRFVFSAGHGSMLLYSLLYLSGYPLGMEELQRFRQWGSHTPGHPERHLDAGIEVTTGPLGQGLANAVGLAMAEAHLAARFNQPDCVLVNHATYALVSDGDLMEGISSEAGSLAGHLRLGKLICLYDDNKISLSGATDLAFTEDVARRFDAFGWHTIRLADGNDLLAVDAALTAARAETERPSLLLCRTHIGFGAPHKQDTFQAHGSPLGAEEVARTRAHFGWPAAPTFYVPDEVLAHFRIATERGTAWETAWRERLRTYQDRYPALAEQFDYAMRNVLPPGWDADVPTFPPDAKGMATRVASGRVMNAIAPRLPALIGGSADLNPSTNTALEGEGVFASPLSPAGDRQGAVSGPWSYAGRNIEFGVREHAMGAISNGLAAHGGTLPFCATFLVFSDYMRPPIRLAALSHLHVVYVFTHDSVALGEDGPTHQPVEQLAALRAIPHLTVIRPGDANETAVAWRVAISHRDDPVALVLTRQAVPTLDRAHLGSADGLRQGAYILVDVPDGAPEIILIASGSEVAPVLAAHHALTARNVRARVVSMPSWELFEAQPRSYREEVFPPAITARLAVEAAVPMGWERYLGNHGAVIGVTDFGASAPGPEVLQRLGFTVDNICQQALALLGKE